MGFVQNSTAPVLSCSVWSLIKSVAKMEAKGKCPAKRTPQTGFLSKGPLEQDPGAQPWVEHQPFLPPCPEPAQLCFIHHIPLFPGMKFTDPGSSQPSVSSHLLLSRDTRSQGHTARHGHCPLCAPGGYNIYFPWNLARRIQSM